MENQNGLRNGCSTNNVDENKNDNSEEQQPDRRRRFIARSPKTLPLGASRNSLLFDSEDENHEYHMPMIRPRRYRPRVRPYINGHAHTAARNRYQREANQPHIIINESMHERFTDHDRDYNMIGMLQYNEGFYNFRPLSLFEVMQYADEDLNIFENRLMEYQLHVHELRGLLHVRNAQADRYLAEQHMFAEEAEFESIYEAEYESAEERERDSESGNNVEVDGGREEDEEGEDGEEGEEGEIHEIDDEDIEIEVCERDEELEEGEVYEGDEEVEDLEYEADEEEEDEIEYDAYEEYEE